MIERGSGQRKCSVRGGGVYSKRNYVKEKRLFMVVKGSGRVMYRIARNFRGLKFSRFSRINDEPRKFYPPKFYLWLTYVARERNPRKLNREKFGQGSSAKLLVLENF